MDSIAVHFLYDGRVYDLGDILQEEVIRAKTVSARRLIRAKTVSARRLIRAKTVSSCVCVCVCV